MLFTNFETLITERRGALHVGAHDGGERDFYKSFTEVLWFEPRKEAFEALERNLLFYPNQTAYNYGIFDETKTAIINVASNGESSSLLKLGTHRIHHPNITYVKKEAVELIRMDEFLQKNEIDISRFNFLNIDVQGVELSVIKSFGSLISQIDYIYTEVNREPLYEGCCLVDEIDKYLDEYGFVRTHTKWTKANWGDAFYMKRQAYERICDQLR